MKSRTSFFDKTVFKKDLTRFAPAWIFYTICLVMGMTLLRQSGSAFSFHRSLDDLPQAMATINFFYAFLTVQLVWGDLYNSRLCNALHALPLRRENWFMSHTAAGLAYSLLPTVLVTPYALLLGMGSAVEQGWHLVLWWLLSTNLQYLFFFSLGTLCIFCVGNRFAHTVVYTITNFASILIYWLVDTLYTPMLYGIHTDQEPFLVVSPCVWMSRHNYLMVERLYDYDLQTTIRAWYEMGDGWGYLAICAAIGVAFLGLSCWLYRKRKLECAGDFMAVKGLEPVFLIVFPLLTGSLAYMFCDEMILNGRGTAIAFLFVGIFVGFFAAKMLLARTIRVFRKKAILQFALLSLCFGSTLLITSLDPLGLVTWIPEQSEITAVEVFPNHYDYDSLLMETPEELEEMFQVHNWALNHQDYGYSGYAFEAATTELLDKGNKRTHNPQEITLMYYLSNGTTRSRYYTVDLMKEPGEILIPYFSSMEAIFDSADCAPTVDALTEYFKSVRINDTILTNAEDIRSLLEAVEADCKAGNMAQRWNFRPEPDVSASYYVNFEFPSQNTDLYTSVEITVYTDCHNTNKWLTDYGIISEVLEEMAKYGIVHGTP